MHISDSGLLATGKQVHTRLPALAGKLLCDSDKFTIDTQCFETHMAQLLFQFALIFAEAKTPEEYESALKRGRLSKGKSDSFICSFIINNARF